MRSIALACLLVTGCDAVFGLERRPVDAQPVDARPPGDGVTPGSCPPAFAGARYLYVPTRQSWPAAEAACIALDTVADDRFTHLAVLTDAAEFLLVSQHLPGNQGEIWVGLTDRKVDNQFVWLTEELPVGHPIPWGSGEPNSTASTITCGAIDTVDGSLEDSACDMASHPYVCECDAFPEVPGRIY